MFGLLSIWRDGTHPTFFLICMSPQTFGISRLFIPVNLITFFASKVQLSSLVGPNILAWPLIMWASHDQRLRLDWVQRPLFKEELPVGWQVGMKVDLPYHAICRSVNVITNVLICQTRSSNIINENLVDTGFVRSTRRRRISTVTKLRNVLGRNRQWGKYLSSRGLWSSNGFLNSNFRSDNPKRKKKKKSFRYLQ